MTEVLTSAAAALGVGGFRNSLGLPSVRRVCVVMVDGLGKSLLKQRSGHAPFLRAALAAGQSFPNTLDAAFPSTTAASLASLGTGVAPGQHGMVGYDVLDPEQNKIVNQLGNWDEGVDPLVWQPFPTVFERLQDELPVVTVSLPKFENTPMTFAALRGGDFAAATSVHARTTVAADLMARNERMLMYFYWGELDKAGHRHGTGSQRWENELEELDSAVKRLSLQLPAGTLLLLTADHGMVDVPEQARIDFAAEPALVEGVRHTGGEPRMLHLYLHAGSSGPDEAARDRLVDAWHHAYGSKAWVLTREEAVSGGYFGSVRPEVLPRIGDVLVAAREQIAFFDTRRVRPAALEVVGQHGSLTKAEREVPLLSIPTHGQKGRRG